MSYVIKTRQSTEINNKEREYFSSLEEIEDYGFKYVPESHFRHIVKNVQRQRCREDEERIWTSFVKEQELNNWRFNKEDGHPSLQSVKDLIRGSIQDVDRELKRLEEDALPERSKRMYKPTSTKKLDNQIHIVKDSTPRNLPIKEKDYCDANILIPILEEEDSVYERSQRTKKLKSAKKSSSDPSIVRKKRYTSQLLRATNYENNSSPELSTQRDNDKDDDAFVQPDPIAIHKILSMQKKITELLDEISFRICRIPQPDGDEDLKRRQQRAMEFAVRFSRNYLYDLNRLVISIQRHITAISPRIGLKQNRRSMIFHQETIEQKLIAAHQLLLQALSAYSKHLPSSVFKGHPTKLKEVLQVVIDLKDICDKVQISTNYFGSGDTDFLPLSKELQNKCDTILAKLQTGLCNGSSNHNTESAALTLASSVPNKKQSKQNLSTRLSMYSVNVKSKPEQKRRNRYCRRQGKCISDIKVPSQHLLHDLPYPSPVTHTSSSRDADRNDSKDEIKTVMDGIPIDSENDSNLEAQSKRNKIERKPKILQKKSLVNMSKKKSGEKKEKNSDIDNTEKDEDLARKVATITKEHLSTLVPVIADLMSLVSMKQKNVELRPVSEASMETLMEFLHKYQSPKDSDTKAPSNCCTCPSNESCECFHYNMNGAHETQNQGKNMRLVCMSAREKLTTLQCNVSCQAESEPAIQSTDGNSTNVNIELIISEETELHFLEYQREYQKICRSKPMYTSNTQNRPWDVVAWISDKLVEELIHEIGKELQMNDVIRKLFEMEFQEF